MDSLIHQRQREQEKHPEPRRFHPQQGLQALQRRGDKVEKVT